MVKRKTMHLDIWQFQTKLTRRLLVWSVFSMAAGLLMLLPPDPLWTGIGVQFLAWGAIDAAIAWFGARAARRRQAKLTSAEALEAQTPEARKLARLLWVNTGLDVLYVLGGVFLARSLGVADPFWFGTGLGIMVQGGFLFLFDWLHARRLA
jgi:hypothetical protein